MKTTNDRRIWWSMVLVAMLLFVLLPNASAEVHEIPPTGETTFPLGQLEKGELFGIKWSISDFDDDVEIWITVYRDGTNTNEYQVTTASGQQNFEALESGSYEIEVSNADWTDTITIDVTVIQGYFDSDGDAQSDSPGFEIIGVVLAIFVCVGFIMWKRRE